MTDQLEAAGSEVADRGGEGSVPASGGSAPRKRVTRWDRPPEPHDWRFFVGGLGKILIVTGLLLFGFVGYQLWGTGIETARAQNALEDEFEQLVASHPDPAEPLTTDPVTTQPLTTEPTIEPTADEQPPEPTLEPTADAPTADEPAPPAVVTPTEPVVQDLPPIERGAPIARLEIPKIAVDVYVVPGVSVSDLKKGPGHYPSTPLPGQLGNAAIAGHRTTYGEPFRHVDQLEPGDEIIVTMANGEVFVYEVTGSTVVQPADSWVIQTDDPTVAKLTLTSCDPPFTAKNRIAIFSELRQEESAEVGVPTYYDLGDDADSDGGTIAEEPTGGSTVDDEVSDDSTTDDDNPTLSLTPPSAPDDDAFALGWFHDKAAFAQIALWAAALIAIAVGGYLLARHYRRTWLGVVAATAPFVVALYFFYQNVNRLLPPGF